MRLPLVVACLAGGVAIFVSAADAQPPQSATLKGRVFVDVLMRPIANAEVTLETLSLSVRSDDKGGFKIANIPPGTHRVRVRQIGYAMYDMSIEFPSGETVERAIVLPRVATLDTVVTVGDANVPLSFLEHRALGFGRFFTREQLEKASGRKLDGVLRQSAGVAMVVGTGGQAWLQSKRYAAPIRSLNPQAGRQGSEDPGESMWRRAVNGPAPGNPPDGCYPRVYLDLVLLNPTSPAEPVDLNAFAPEQLEAIEVFTGPAQIPLEYQRLNSVCGVVVLHRRRSR